MERIHIPHPHARGVVAAIASARDRLVALGFWSLSSVASRVAARLLSATFDRFHFHRPVFCAFNCPHRHFLNSLLWNVQVLIGLAGGRAAPASYSIVIGMQITQRTTGSFLSRCVHPRAQGRPSAGCQADPLPQSFTYLAFVEDDMFLYLCPKFQHWVGY